MDLARLHEPVSVSLFRCGILDQLLNSCASSFLTCKGTYLIGLFFKLTCNLNKAIPGTQ